MIRLAVIDANERVQDYAAALPRLRNVSITALVGRDMTASATLRTTVGEALVAETWEQLLGVDERSFDAVVIHSDTSQRGELVRRAAEFGKHVFVDAPLAESLAEWEQTVATCRDANVILMVAQPLRFMAYQQAVRESLVAGNLGVPGLLRIHHWHPHGELTGEDATDAACVELIIHEVDLACWLFEAAPDVVYAQAVAGDPAHGVQLHLGFPDGGMALIDRTRTLPVGAVPYYSLTLIGSKGAAYADDHHNTNLLLQRQVSGLLVEQGRDSLRLRLQEFADAIDQGREPSCSSEEGKTALVVAQAALASCQAHQAVKVIED